MKDNVTKTWHKKLSILLQAIWFVVSIIILNEYGSGELGLSSILLMIYVSMPILAYQTISWFDFLSRPLLVLGFGISAQVVAVFLISRGLNGHLEDWVLFPMISSFCLFYTFDKFDIIRKALIRLP